MWTEERVELLKKLWAEGLSASQVAKQLGGVTRNAVIGKVHRLGLSGRVTTQTARKRAAPKPAAPARPAPPRYYTNATATSSGNAATARKLEPSEAPAARPAPKPVALTVVATAPEMEAESQTAPRATVMTLTERACKWPIGDPGTPEFHFCGAAKEPGQSYCEEHAKRAYQPIDPRRSRRTTSA